MTPVERRIAEFDVTLDAIKALGNNQWEGDKLNQAAGYIKARMQQKKAWKESSNAKRPEKDKAYQRTLIVRKFLG